MAEKPAGRTPAGYRPRHGAVFNDYAVVEPSRDPPRSMGIAVVNPHRSQMEVLTYEPRPR